MRNDKKSLAKMIYKVDFAIHELVLFLDTHPRNAKAMELLEQYRELRCEKIEEYERNFGTFVVTPADVKPSEYWGWLKSPWPWENNFWEEK